MFTNCMLSMILTPAARRWLLTLPDFFLIEYYEQPRRVPRVGETVLDHFDAIAFSKNR